MDFRIQHIIERRVGGDAAVPIMLAVDHDWRESPAAARRTP